MAETYVDNKSPVYVFLVSFFAVLILFIIIHHVSFSVKSERVKAQLKARPLAGIGKNYFETNEGREKLEGRRLADE
jgi:uncharacterized membrane protein